MSLLLLFNQQSFYSISFTDGFAVSDSLVKGYYDFESDSLSMVDSIANNLNLIKSDIITIVDSTSGSFIKSLSDSFTLIDAITKAIPLINDDGQTILHR